jgi:predicted pyridoxine 5'-phosphate oxidase superfamily flavin-nucleotide-binding protein
MKRKSIQKAVDMGNRVGYVLVATSDSTGLPHLAASGKIEAAPEGHVAVSEWFCPETLSNLDVNPKTSLVVWDPSRDKGFQLIGETGRSLHEAKG